MVRDRVHRATHPAALFDFGVGALGWNSRVQAYLLLLDDGYPPFSLHA